MQFLLFYFWPSNNACLKTLCKTYCLKRVLFLWCRMTCLTPQRCYVHVKCTFIFTKLCSRSIQVQVELYSFSLRLLFNCKKQRCALTSLRLKAVSAQVCTHLFITLRAVTLLCCSSYRDTRLVVLAEILLYKGFVKCFFEMFTLLSHPMKEVGSKNSG